MWPGGAPASHPSSKSELSLCKVSRQVFRSPSKTNDHKLHNCTDAELLWHLNWISWEMYTTTHLLFSTLPRKTPGVQLLPEITKNRITKAREVNWEGLLKQGSLAFVLLDHLIALGSIKSSILNHTSVWALYAQSDLLMSQHDERKEESERGNYKGQWQIITPNSYGELPPTSHYCFETWQNIFLDILINSFPSPLTVFIHI